MTALEYVARHRRDLPLFVNISGRFTMSDIYGTMDAVLQIIDEQGFYELKVEFGDLTYGGKVGLAYHSRSPALTVDSDHEGERGSSTRRGSTS